MLKEKEDNTSRKSCSVKTDSTDCDWPPHLLISPPTTTTTTTTCKKGSKREREREREERRTCMIARQRSVRRPAGQVCNFRPDFSLSYYAKKARAEVGLLCPRVVPKDGACVILLTVKTQAQMEKRNTLYRLTMSRHLTGTRQRWCPTFQHIRCRRRHILR